MALASISVNANWSSFTYLGTISDVDFHYRTTDQLDDQQVQFKVTNTNSMRARIKISDIEFHCAEGGVVEMRNDISFRLNGSEEKIPQTSESVCSGFGGLDYLTVNIDARVRRN
jgi:hypothetical protein